MSWSWRGRMSRSVELGSRRFLWLATASHRSGWSLLVSGVSVRRRQNAWWAAIVVSCACRFVLLSKRTSRPTYFPGSFFFWTRWLEYRTLSLCSFSLIKLLTLSFVLNGCFNVSFFSLIDFQWKVKKDIVVSNLLLLYLSGFIYTLLACKSVVSNLSWFSSYFKKVFLCHYLALKISFPAVFQNFPFSLS